MIWLQTFVGSVEISFDFPCRLVLAAEPLLLAGRQAGPGTVLMVALAVAAVLLVGLVNVPCVLAVVRPFLAVA